MPRIDRSKSAAEVGVQPVLRLLVSAGPHAGAVVMWGQAGNYVIGRGPQAHLPLTNDLVTSVEHCRIEWNEHGGIIEDLGSRYGTTVNDCPITRSLLHAGDVIKVGQSEIKVAIDEPLEPGTTVMYRSRQSRSGMTGSGTRAVRGGQLDTIPGYHIVRRLGAGGMGVVYEARRQSTGERVAVKTIIPAAGSPQNRCHLFLREGEVLSQLQHPHIVRFIEMREHEGQLFLAMEFVETVDLRSLAVSLTVQREVQLFCGVLCQVLDALQHAHELGLVHRDVKPQNILVSRDGRKLHAKLSDFGLAKNYHQAGLSQLTEDGDLRGTLAFMPLEQFRNSRYAKPAVDIYASGATLYWYLTGKSPLPRAPRDFADLEAMLSSSTPLSSLRPDVPKRLAEIIHCCLAPEPQHRFSTAGELRMALLPFASAQTIRDPMT